MSSPAYAEIGRSHDEFLVPARGIGSAGYTCIQAGKLRLPVIGIADHNTLAGVGAGLQGA